VTSSLVWSLGHAGNADPIWLKLAQIFLLGLLFGWLAHRHNVESAIMAHVGLNVAALVGGYFLEWSV
jgi:membrane protease YdiL (CAAX protease family)